MNINELEVVTEDVVREDRVSLISAVYNQQRDSNAQKPQVTLPMNKDDF